MRSSPNQNLTGHSTYCLDSLSIICGKDGKHVQILQTADKSVEKVYKQECNFTIHKKAQFADHVLVSRHCRCIHVDMLYCIIKSDIM